MELISKDLLFDWIDYMLKECYGDPDSGQQIFGVDGYREGTMLLKSLRLVVNRGDFDPK